MKSYKKTILFNLLALLLSFPFISISQENEECKFKKKECFNQYIASAESLTKQEKFSEAEKYYALAFSFNHEVENYMMAVAWANRAWNLKNLGDLENAKRWNHKAIEYFEDPNLGYKYTQELSSLYNNEALFHRENGNHEKALRSFHDSIDYSFDDAESLIKDEYEEKDITILFNTGAEYFRTFQYVEATRYLDRAINISIGMGLSNGDIAKIYALKSEIAYERGKTEEAKSLIKKAKEIAKNITTEDSSLFAEIIRTNAKYLDSEQAEMNLKKAIDIYLNIFPERNIYRMRGYEKYGDFLNEQGRYLDADFNYNKAIENGLANIGFQNDWIVYPRIQAAKAKNFCDMGKIEDGLVLIEKVINKIEIKFFESEDSILRNEPNINENFANYLGIKSECLQKNDDDQYAFKIRSKATSIYEHILRSDQSFSANYQLRKREQFRDSFIKHIDLIESLGLMDNLEYFNESLKLSQLAQSSLASLAINEREARSEDIEIKNKELQYQRYLRDRENIEEQIEQQRALPNQDDQLLSRLEIELKNVRKFEARALRNLKTISPSYLQYITANITDLNDAQSIIENGQLLINFIAAQEKIYSWAISKDAFIFQSTSDADLVYEEINEYRQNIDLPTRTRIAPRGTERFPFELSNNIYQRLFQPLLRNFNQISELLIIPDGTLHIIPFGSLSYEAVSDFKKPNWLIEKYAISILPSLDSFTVAKNIDQTNLSNLRFAGFGDPLIGESYDFNNDLISRGMVESFDEIVQLPPLPETKRELELISDNFKDQNIRLFLGKEATEENVKRTDLRNFNIIAFATHAISTNINSNLAQPSLILTPIDQNFEQNDGILTAFDVSKLELNADLVLLSACETANTHAQKDQAYTGLSEAFFFAGAKAILATHWEVETNSAVEITSGLVGNLTKNNDLSYSQALQMSILDLISKEEKFSHPYYWGPFIMVGNN